MCVTHACHYKGYNSVHVTMTGTALSSKRLLPGRTGLCVRPGVTYANLYDTCLGAQVLAPSSASVSRYKAGKPPIAGEHAGPKPTSGLSISYQICCAWHLKHGSQLAYVPSNSNGGIYEEMLSASASHRTIQQLLKASSLSDRQPSKNDTSNSFLCSDESPALTGLPAAARVLFVPRVKRCGACVSQPESF